VELSELLLVSLVFFGLAAAQQQKQHFSVELLTQHLPERVQRGLELIACLLCLAIIVLIAWPSSKQAIVSYERGEAGFGIVPFPIWPARTILAAGLWLLALQFVIDAIRLLTSGRASSAQVRIDPT
jgi:TRAP-type C4-dicarboxylate transport system permease small subunit